MTAAYPRFTEHPDKAIRFIEYHALKKLVYDGSTNKLCEAHPEFEGRWPIGKIITIPSHTRNKKS